MQASDTYNRGGMIAFVFSMFFSLAFFFYIALVHPGVDLKEVPTEAMQPGPEGSTPVAAAAAGADISKIEKAWEPNDQVVAYGAEVFKKNCAVCHGDKGLGDGPAGKALVPPPRNFVEGKWKVGGDSVALFNTVKNGISGSSMAPFGHLPVKDRWAVVQFIRSITKNKVADDAAKLDAFAKTAN